ncbi:hypothetical protein CF394_05075 [Tetzosporium hominis]|uniref:Thioredoxin domain-containing protein n=1 Tax=Tetzosporium hominis TaxID=2020506 RepID=A0A264W538_9BACL|nr:TlpA disulfide reductase family protein [Tetzosporium hominis]OZS78661.1 hypothetical protein CF394_05075 [Tetzosporium hominis]
MKLVRRFAVLSSILLLSSMVVMMIQMNFGEEEYPSGMIENQSGLLPTESFDEGIQIGMPAPDFVLETLDGELVRLSDYRGKKVFLNFWASWCGPCQDEAPEMQKFYETSPDDSNNEILAVNMTTKESSRDDVIAFSQKHGLTFPILIDPNGEVEKLYQVIAYPTSYIVNAEGIITYAFKGPISDSKELENLLTEY